MKIFTSENVVLSDDLNQAIDEAAEKTHSTKSEILRKAIQLFLAAQAGKEKGKKLGLVDAVTEKLETEFIGL